MIIVAVPTFGEGGLNELLNPRFGRCNSFTFVTIENNEIKAVKTVPNHGADAMGGAGVQATQTVGNNGATVVIAGNLGPNAYQSLYSLNIKIFKAPIENKTVKQCIDLYLENKLIEMSNANVAPHFGMGQGGGGGMGRGGGMGGGRRSNF
jgi:predicted Fe-Mo cluster-binding NifX family protein